MKAGISLVAGTGLWLLALLFFQLNTGGVGGHLFTLFQITMFIAGVFLARGFWLLSSGLTKATARFSARLLAVNSVAVGLGFGFGVDPSPWLELAGVGVLLVAPMGLALLSVGLANTRDLTAWGRLVPLAVAGFGIFALGVAGIPGGDQWLFVLPVAWVAVGVSAMVEERRPPAEVESID